MFGNKLEKKVEQLERTLATNNTLFSEFLGKLEGYFEKLDNKTDANNAWLKEFHRLALSEYMSGPKKKVYAFIYFKPSNGENRLILVARDTFEEAEVSSKASLTEVGEKPDIDWVMQTYKSLDIPYGSFDVIDKTEKLMPLLQKPIDVYLNEIKLLRDRFCDKKSEKKVVDSLMIKIKKSYINK